MRLSVCLFGLLLGCSPKVAAEDATNCQAYLDCLAETDPEVFEQEIGVYGNSGSCFSDADADDCQTACLNKLEDLGQDDVEACQPPPEPEPETESDTDPDAPEPDANGYVDCAEIVGGPTVGPGEPGPLGFPEAACNPRSSGMAEHKCCSDDPAAAGGDLPGYQGQTTGGSTPNFSGLNNALGTSGLCVRTSDIPAGSGLSEPAAAGCPIPCNPTWEDSDVSAVCGANRVCCQTREMQAQDCIRDDDGTWRPAVGHDILEGKSNWAPANHATHQDPNGQGCASLAGSSDVSNPDFTACLETLSVADQRGFCMALQPGQACPGQQSGYIDACEQINMGLLPPPV